jgi:hypothetical protein
VDIFTSVDLLRYASFLVAYVDMQTAMRIRALPHAVPSWYCVGMESSEKAKSTDDPIVAIARLLIDHVEEERSCR